MITKHDDLLGTLIHDVAHLLRLDIDRRLKKHKLTRVKWLALGIIQHQPSMSQSELAAEMELGNAPVGRLIDRLEQRGFIDRVSDPEDRRVSRLQLTKSATKLLAELDEMGVEIRHDLLDGLSAADVKKLNGSLNKLKDNLKKKSMIVSAVTMAILFQLNEVSELSAFAVPKLVA